MNLVVGILAQIFIMLFGIINRKAFLQFIGIEYLGLQDIVQNFFSFTSICGFGIITSTNVFFYKSSANNREDFLEYILIRQKACLILSFVIFIFGLFMVCFSNELINSNISQNLIKIVILIFTISTTISMALDFSQAVLICDQNAYEVYKSDLLVSSLFFVIQLLIIFLLKNYLLYVVAVALKIVTMSFICFKKIKTKYSLKSIKQKISKPHFEDVIRFSKKQIVIDINSLVYNSTDNVIVSKILGTLYVGYLNNYQYIFNTIIVLANRMITSVNASVASILNDKKNDNIQDMDNVINIHYALTNCVVFFCLFFLIGITAPFIGLFFGTQYVYGKLEIPLCLLFYTQLMQEPINCILLTTGNQIKERWASLISSVMNILISIILVINIGLEGVIYGTVISNAFMMWYRFLIIYKCGLYNSIDKYIYRQFIDSFVGVLIIVTYLKIKKLFITNNLMISFISNLVLATFFYILYFVYLFLTNKNILYIIREGLNVIKGKIKND